MKLQRHVAIHLICGG